MNTDHLLPFQKRWLDEAHPGVVVIPIKPSALDLEYAAWFNACQREFDRRCREAFCIPASVLAYNEVDATMIAKGALAALPGREELKESYDRIRQQ